MWGVASDEESTTEFGVKQLGALPANGEIGWEVSIIQLLSSPEKYNNRFVRVYGFLSLDFEREKLFLHREDYENWLEANSINIGKVLMGVREKMENMEKNYVFLEGRFYYKEGDSKGTIWDISRTIKVPMEFEFEEPKEEE